MHSLSKTILILFSSLCFGTFAYGVPDIVDWNQITVDAVADQPVSIEQRIRSSQDGFLRLEVSLSNPGTSVLTLDSVEITIPFVTALSRETDLVYGSSCMGQRPMLREALGERMPQEDMGRRGDRSYSYMFELVRLSADRTLLLGSLSWRVFLPVLSVSESGLHITAEGEGKQLRPGETLAFETLALKESSDWVGLLQQFGKAIAAENGIDSVKDVEFTGWATWDYYGRLFQTEDVMSNMEQVNALFPASHLIQIDGGWWTERGDYQSVRPDLPGGIKAMAEAIREAGNIPGLHFDGFRADLASEVYRKHPEFFLHDQDGNVIVDHESRYDRDMNHIFFDFSHPGARAHIAECVATMREWGITYFKVDFMRYGLESEIRRKLRNVKKVVAHDPTISGVERFRLGMQTLRDAIGDENYFLGCSAVFGPTIGFVDGMRTGGDVHPVYEEFRERVLANSGNFYLDGVVYNADVDYLVFREGADEDERVSGDPKKSGNTLPLNEARTWADYNKLFGNCRLQSDNLNLLRPERKALVREVFEWPAADESVPLDVWESASDRNDGFEVILSRRSDQIFLGLFNWGDAAKTYDLTPFGLKTPVLLEGRHSTILVYQGEDNFDGLARKLQNR